MQYSKSVFMGTIKNFNTFYFADIHRSLITGVLRTNNIRNKKMYSAIESALIPSICMCKDRRRANASTMPCLRLSIGEKVS